MFTIYMPTYAKKFKTNVVKNLILDKIFDNECNSEQTKIYIDNIYFGCPSINIHYYH